MDYMEEMAKYYTTQKQKDFTPDFLDPSQIDHYEFWDEIQIGEESEIPTKFEVKAEDLKAFARAFPLLVIMVESFSSWLWRKS